MNDQQGQMPQGQAPQGQDQQGGVGQLVQMIMQGLMQFAQILQKSNVATPEEMSELKEVIDGFQELIQSLQNPAKGQGQQPMPNQTTSPEAGAADVKQAY